MIAVVVVGYNVAQTIAAVIQAIPSEFSIFVVDDGSEDDTAALVGEGVTLLRHPQNKGYGAAQRSGYNAAIDAGAERIALLHGDGQYLPRDVLALLDALDDADVALGSRFLMADKGAIIPWWRRLANRGLTTFANRRFGCRMTDLHTGARAFRASALQQLPLDQFSDDYVFDQQVLVHLICQNARFVERPVQTRYDDEVQSISFRRSVIYGLGCLREIAAARR